MVASIFTASLGVQCAVFAVVSAVTLAVMLPLLAKRRTMRQPPITNGSPLTIGSRGIVLREIPQGDIGRVRVDGLDWQARTVDGTPLPRAERSTTLTITPGSLRWIQPSSTISASFCSFADTSYAPAFEMI